MLLSLRRLFGQYSPLLLLLLALTSTVGCSGTPLSLLTGGGPNVAANTQLGQQNTQTVGSSETVKTDIREVTGDVLLSNDKGSGKTGSGNVVVNNTNIDPILLLLLVLGWLLPSPQEMVRTIINAFKRKL
jgi:hypothetical protein